MVQIATQKDKIAIVVVGYNRLPGLMRLLDSLQKAVYPSNNIPLVISIDSSGCEPLYEYVRNFEWKHGEKFVNIEETRLGLKKHILQCGQLSQYFKAIILLEDDLYVSPDFYYYSLKTTEKYYDEDKVAGISLYFNEMDGYVGVPFQALHNGSDVFAWQVVSSWGEIWTDRMWADFTQWLTTWDENFDSLDMNSYIKGWTRAWSKYYYAYEISNDKYFIYPYVSLTTNFADVGGEHGGTMNDTSAQVALMQGHKDYQLWDFEKLVKYDNYGNNISMKNYIDIDDSELTLDLNGLRVRDSNYRRYILSPMNLPCPVVKSYGLLLRPMELNVIEGIEGDGLFIYDTKGVKLKSKKKPTLQYINYHLRCFNLRYMIKYFKYMFGKKIKQKINI